MDGSAERASAYSYGFWLTEPLSGANRNGNDQWIEGEVHINPEDELEEIRAHEQIWQGLYDNASAVLDRFGRKGYRETDDYWIVDDDWGWNVLQVELQDAILFSPGLVSALQTLPADYADWVITLNVGQRARTDAPGMGLVIHPDRIVDELKREFLPPEFREMRFS